MVKQVMALNRIEERLRQLLPESWRLRLRPKERNQEPDAELVLRDPTGRTVRVVVEVKARALPAEIAPQLERYAKQGRNRLVVAPSLGPRARELLARNGIGWMELDGDLRLVADGVFVERIGASGRRRRNGSRRFVADLFSGKASRIVRWLLIESDKRWTVTEMQERADTSIGFVSRTFATLARDAYVARERGATRLVRGEELLDAWAAAVSTQPPRDEKFEGVSLAARGEVLRMIAEREPPSRYALTAEAAAEQLAPFARLTRVELYAPALDRWQRFLQLTPVPVGGNVVLIRPEDEGVFDGSQEVNGLKLVSLPQLYVDLRRREGTGSAAAEFLRQRIDLLRRRNPQLRSQRRSG